MYAANNIYFYCDTSGGGFSGNFSSICGDTAREKYWSALMAAGFKDFQVAAMFGSIDHEGGFGPTLWEWYDTRRDWGIVDINSHQFRPGITWDRLLNNCDSSKCGGVGAFQITWELSSYLQGVQNNAPDLIKYFQNPESYQLKGDEMLEKIGATDFDKLVQQEINLFVLGSRKASSDGLKATQTLEEAADYWTKVVENCENCCGNSDKDKSCEQLAPRRASAQKTLDDMKTFTCDSSTSSSSSSGSGGGAYAGAKYNFTDDQLKRLWWAATAEEGEAGEEGIKTELSLFANRFESKHVHNGTPGDNQGLINSVLSSDYASTTHEAYRTGAVQQWGDSYPEPSSEQISSAKSILNNGNRTLPAQVIEHDRLGDIKRVTNNGTEFDKSDRSQYKTGVTTIYNVYRDEDPNDPPYIFFRWANGEQVCSSGSCGDPFGWKSSDDAPSQPSTATSGNANSGSCSDTATSTTSSTGNGDILKAVEEIIQLANQNGSTYTWGGGHDDNESIFQSMLNGSPVNVDCTGFASLVMYKVYGEVAAFNSASIFDDSRYEEVPRNEVRPGDIFAYTAPKGHGGIVVEASNGVVTKIAETGGEEGRSGNNNNIGYSTGDDFSIRNMNGENGHFFRHKGA